MTIVGKNIKQKRMELGLTQRELGLQCGFSNGAVITRSEKQRAPGPETLEKIARGLRTTPEALLQEQKK